MPGGGIAVRWLGIVLVLTGAAGGFILTRRQSLIPLRLAQALLVDLGVLVSHVCTARRPLPEILAADLAGGSSLQQGMAWAVENGLTDGSNPSGAISRQQLAVVLYRYAGSPSASTFKTTRSLSVSQPTTLASSS